MLADEQADIAKNSAISTGEVEFVLARGRDHWNCSCEEYAGKVWKVDDTDRPSIPVHPNCACEWRPKLKTDAEILAEFEKGNRDYLEAEHGEQSEQPSPVDNLPDNPDVVFEKYNVDSSKIKVLPEIMQKETAESLQRIYNDIPAAHDVVTSISVNNRLSRTYAQCYVMSGKIELQGNLYRNPEALKNAYESDLKLSYHPAGTTHKSIFTHEVAHAITGKIAKQRGVPYEDVCDDIQKKSYDRLGH